MFREDGGGPEGDTDRDLGAAAIVYGLWFTVAQSSAWLGVARWFRDLPLT